MIVKVCVIEREHVKKLNPLVLLERKMEAD